MIRRSFQLRVRMNCLLLFFLLAFSAISQGQPSQSVSTSQDLRKLIFDVIDKTSNSPVTLRPEDLRLLENEKPLEIVGLRKVEDEPLTIALLIDTSVSQERTLASQKLAADAFVQSVMRPGKDQAALITFTVDKTVEQTFTGDIALLRDAIARTQVMLPAGYVPGGIIVSRTGKSNAPQLAGSTALWDAIYTTSANSFPANTRKILVLLSDGNDTASRAELRDAVKNAVNAGVEVYAIGIGDERMGGVNKDELRKLSERTGGEAFFPEKVKDLERVFAQIQQSLRSRYEITYRGPAAVGKSPKIKVQVTNPALRPKDLRIRYQPMDAPAAR